MKHTYLNKSIKNIIATFIVFTMLTSNTVFAFDEYFKINNPSNKTINVNLSTVEIKGDTVNFSTKRLKDNGEYIISRMSINTVEKTAKLLKMDVFDKKGTSLSSKDFSDKNSFKPIKDGTLMADLYDIAITLKLSSETFVENSNVWNKYFKNLGKKITKHYHPNILRWKQGLSTENKFVSVIVLVDKSGKVLSYGYENHYPVKYKDFDDKFKKHVDNIFLKDDKFFPQLPKEYNGDKIIMKFRICYTQNAEYKTFTKQYSTKKDAGTFEVNKTTAPVIGLPLFFVTITRCAGIFGITFASIPIGIFAPEATDKFTSHLYEKL